MRQLDGKLTWLQNYVKDAKMKLDPVIFSYYNFILTEAIHVLAVQFQKLREATALAYKGTVSPNLLLPKAFLKFYV